MTSLRTRYLLFLGALACCAGGLMMVLADNAGLSRAPILPATFVIVCLVLAAALVWLGFQVSKFRDRERRADAKAMNPLLAARVAVLAQATALTGSALVGWHVPFLVSYVSLISVRGFTASLWVTLADLVGGLLLVGAGLWVESMCKIPPSDSSQDGGGSAPPRENPGYAARQSRTSDR